MRNDTENPGERDEIEMLLPWYVTGKLDETDRRRVADYLARHPEMAGRLALSFAELTETAHLNRPLPQTSGETVDLFMAQLNPSEDQQVHADSPIRRRLSAMMHGLRSVLEASLPQTGSSSWVAAAAALIILLQAAAILTLVVTRPGEPYRFATGESDVMAPGAYVLVRFNEGASAARIGETLSEWGLTIAGGPRAGGVFTLRIGPETMNQAERERVLSLIRNRTDIFVFVTPTR